MKMIEIGLPDDLLTDVPAGHEIVVAVGKEGDLVLSEGRWVKCGPGAWAKALVARPAPPWIPQDWVYDPKFGVYEVTPGEWPPCNPGDWVEVLTRCRREERSTPVPPQKANAVRWSKLSTVVAIRIVTKEVS
jgi:hypothetical protein